MPKPWNADPQYANAKAVSCIALADRQFLLCYDSKKIRNQLGL